MGMTVTIRVEQNENGQLFAIQEKLTIEAIKQSKFDLVATTIYKLVDIINSDILKERHARHSGANS